MNAQTKSLAQLGAAAFLALLAGVLVFQWMQSTSSRVQKSAQTARTVPLVVAARDLSAGTKLEPSMLRVAEFPETLLPALRYGTPQELAGRVLASSVSANEPLTPSRLTGEAASGGISAVVTPGKRAMAVRGNKVMGLAGFIRPGNKVDVLVTIPVDGEGKRTMTKTVLENVPVLAAGTQMTSDNDEATVQADVYTLELTPQESEKLALASTQGTLHFALRNAEDTATVLTDGADAKATLASYRTQRPKSVNAAYTVELISGSNRSTMKF